MCLKKLSEVICLLKYLCVCVHVSARRLHIPLLDTLRPPNQLLNYCQTVLDFSILIMGGSVARVPSLFGNLSVHRENNGTRGNINPYGHILGNLCPEEDHLSAVRESRASVLLYYPVSQVLEGWIPQQIDPRST